MRPCGHLPLCRTFYFFAPRPTSCCRLACSCHSVARTTVSRPLTHARLCRPRPPRCNRCSTSTYNVCGNGGIIDASTGSVNPPAKQPQRPHTSIPRSQTARIAADSSQLLPPPCHRPATVLLRCLHTELGP